MNEASLVPPKVCTACGGRYPGDALFCPTDGTPLQNASAAERDVADVYLGQEISGHIEIRQLVGIGAMGRVYRAFQRGIDRDVAVKILHRELSANAQLVSRFTREAKVASRLQHPNVVQVLLAGQLPDRALYMVMEYLDGLSMQSALAAAGGALPLPRALHIVFQLCEAAGEAHAQGIVHRDLKPENVMLVRRGADNDFVKVLDFGIARINWGEQSVATAAGLIFGTARYISPEGAQGNAVGPASDVYSIATLLYQMLSGRTPFEGDQAVGLLVQQIHDAPPSLKSLPRAHYVPDPIAEVVMANLAKDPKKREPDARALGHAILDAARAAGLSADDFSRPLLRRQPNAMQMPPVERTKQLELSPELAARLTPEPSGTNLHGASPPPVNGSNGANGTNAANGSRAMQASTLSRAPSAATAKWEPSEDFQARLAGPAATARSSDRIPAAGSWPRGVDETLDDASVEPPPAFPEPPNKTTVPRTMPGDVASVPRTQYTPPAPEFAQLPAGHRGQPTDPPLLPRDRPSQSPAQETPSSAPGRSSRGILLVVLCFALGALLAAGWAWRMGRLGGEIPEQDRFVARATDAMFKNRFHDPPGENVKDLTDEGLRRWPNDRRLVDIRIRASSELTNQALAQRSAGDVAEALKLARLALDLDPNDASAKRLVEQYEGELATFNSPAAPPLGTTQPAKPPSAVAASGSGATAGAAAGYKVILDVSVASPKLGQNVELTARVMPPTAPKGGFDAPGFTIAGPAVPGGLRVPAQSGSPGIFKATHVFVEPGKYEVTFSVQADGKPLSAKRAITAGDAAAAKPASTGHAGTSAAPLPSPSSAASGGAAPLPSPAPAGSVKWM